MAKALITKVEAIGDKGIWTKFSFLKESGEAGSTIIQTAKYEQAGLDDMVVDTKPLFEENEAVELDFSSSMVGRVESITKAR